MQIQIFNYQKIFMGSCIGLCSSICCCECNFLVFPSPQGTVKNSYNFNQMVKTFKNSRGDIVPYLEMSTPRTKKNIIYFHGNAEDIGIAFNFLIRFHEILDANIYAIQYPTYGAYKVCIPARISDGIKADSLDFFDYLSDLSMKEKNPITTANTLIIGRSIGSGGACYLASRRNFRYLALISPFSTIPNVANDFVGFIGRFLIKCHFDNIEEISNYHGRLLIIHGKVDEVINYRHALLLRQKYNIRNQRCELILHPKMSHNDFDLCQDILKPIGNFLQQMQKADKILEKQICQ